MEKVPLPEDLLRQAHEHFTRRELVRARSAIKRVLINHPHNLEARVLAAMVAEVEGTAKEAWEEVERVMVYRGKLSPFLLQPVLYAAAEHYVKQDREERARLFLDELWRRFPTGSWSVKAQMMVARDAFARKRWTSVIRTCKVLSRLRPTDPEVRTCRRLMAAAKRMLEVGPEPPATAQRWIWEHPWPQGNALNDAWSSGRLLFAVGEAGTIVFKDRRGRLSTMPSGTRWSLKGIWGSDPKNIYAVGVAGVVVHYDGKRWKVVRQPDPTAADLWGIFTARAGHAVAVGDGGTVVQLRDGRWVTSHPVSIPLRGVWGPDTSTLFAVGSGGSLLRFVAGRWQTISSDSYEDLWGIWGVKDHSVAVGNRKTVVHLRDGKSKEQVVGRGDLRDVWGTGARAVWAVGKRGEVVKFDGKTWRNEPTGCLNDLRGVAGQKAEMWSVGDGGTMIRRRGRWSVVAGGIIQDLVSITAGPSIGEGYALGNQGLMLRRSRKGRWKQSGGLPLFGVYRDMWRDGRRWIVVGDRGLMVVKRGGTWKRVKTDTPEDLVAVWGYAGGAVAVGTRGTVIRLVGTRVVRDQLPTGLDLRDVWGDSRSLYAVGNRGMILRFNGEQWVELESNVLADLHGVWGGSSKELVFVVGDGGTVLTIKQGRITRHTTPVSHTLLDIWGSSDSMVFAISQRGGILRYDGSRWSVQNSPAACLNAISGDPATGVLAVGCRGTVLRWKP